MALAIICTTALAAESNEHSMPDGLVGTTIEVTVEPDEDLGIMPLIWGQDKPSVGSNSSVDTNPFTVPERYFAFECSATGSSSGNYSVALKQGSGTIASANKAVNGETTKIDWIDLKSSNNTCYFRVSNGTSSSISVILTYYSWS